MPFLFSNLKSIIVNQKSLSGIYIHIPFCKQACHYCNFHFATSLQFKDPLIAALIKEIKLTSFFEADINTADNVIKTVYLGGGTPSIIDMADIDNIFSAIRNKFKISSDAEITLEANPDDINPAALAQWKSMGINRLSVGIQSFIDEELVWMNRTHTAAESINCIEEIRASGVDNFSIDLIYGSPLLSNKQWEKNVAIALEKKIPHIAAYALTIEPKTPLDKMIRLHKKATVDADKQAEQFLLLMQWMEAAGYEHYEISNFALPGKRSRHNSSYWQGKKYYGFGPSAHSFNGQKRQWNIANNAQYIQSIQNNIIPFEAEILTPTQQLNEYIMTSLRTMEGLDVAFVASRFGSNFSEQIETAVLKWIATEKLYKMGDAYILTKEGKLLADGIAADLFF